MRKGHNYFDKIKKIIDKLIKNTDKFNEDLIYRLFGVGSILKFLLSNNLTAK
jgi:hypothetical protein